MSADGKAHRALAELTANMATLAEVQDFDGLDALAPDYERLSRLVQEMPLEALRNMPQLESDIRQIMANQDRIAEHAGPWLVHVKKMLRQERQERSVVNAYNAAG